MPATNLTAEELEILREAVTIYLADLCRQVAGTENPQFRRELQHRQNVLEGIVGHLERSAAA